MTDTECNKFLTLLMGKKAHNYYYCPECKRELEWYEVTFEEFHDGCGAKVKEKSDNPDHLADPLGVIRWMEKEMPEVWEKYTRYTFSVYAIARVGINKVLDLRNLVDYLWEHQEWGEKECTHCYGFETHLPNGISCPICNGTGKIIHPALQYLRNIKEVGG